MSNERYAPYKTFVYEDGDVICTMRLEDTFGVSFSGKDGRGELAVIAQLSDGCFMKISGFANKAAVSRFISTVAEGIEKEEERVAYNKRLDQSIRAVNKAAMP